MRILLVSPSDTEAAYLHKALQESAHSVHRSDDYRDAIFLASQERFEAIVIVAPESRHYLNLLDMMQSFTELPNRPTLVVMLGPASSVERAKILRAGAEVCFTYPYSVIEMQERILAVRRTVYRDSKEEATRVPPIKLEALTRELVYGSWRISVTRREFLLLECLLREINIPVAREQLIRYAWPEKEEVDPSSVNLMVARLRRKLEQTAPQIKIETVSRFGYQITVDS